MFGPPPIHCSETLQDPRKWTDDHGGESNSILREDTHSSCTVSRRRPLLIVLVARVRVATGAGRVQNLPVAFSLTHPNKYEHTISAGIQNELTSRERHQN